MIENLVYYDLWGFGYYLTLNKECCHMNKWELSSCGGGINLMNKFKKIILTFLVLQVQAPIFSMNFFKKGFFRKEPALHVACKKGDQKKVKRLIEESHKDVNEQNKQGDTPLHVAVKHAKILVVEYLLGRGDINLVCTNNFGETAFDIVCKEGKVAIARYISNEMEKRGIDLSLVYNNACKRGKVKTLEQLDALSNGGLSSQDMLFSACEHGQKEVVRYLVGERGYLVDATDDDENTTLRIVCQHNQLVIVKYLLSQGANVEARSYDGHTPLSCAIMCGHIRIVKEILDYDRDLVNKQDEHGWAPIHYACRNGQLDIVKLLDQKYDVNMHVCTHEDSKAIDLAKRGKFTDIVEYLQKIEKKHISDLYQACDSGKLDIVKHLVEECKVLLDQKYKDKDGHGPIDIACNGRHKEIVEYLYNRADKKSLLKRLCADGHIDIIKYLIEEDICDVNELYERNKENFFDVACKRKRKEIVIYLYKKFIKETWLPVYEACAQGKLEIVKYLLEVVSNIIDLKDSLDYQDNLGDIFCVIYRGKRKKIAEYLYNRGSKGQILCALCEGHCFGAITYLVEEGICNITHIDIACKNKLKYVARCIYDRENRVNSGNFLRFLCKNGLADAIKYLVKKGICDVAQEYKKDSRFFEEACSYERKIFDKRKTFLDDGPFDKISAEYLHKKLVQKDIAPIHDACRTGDLQEVAFFSKKLYWFCNVKDRDGNRPIDVACMHDQIEVVKYIYENEGSFFGILTRICEHKNLETLKYVLKKGICDLMREYDYSRCFLYEVCKFPGDFREKKAFLLGQMKGSIGEKSFALVKKEVRKECAFAKYLYDLLRNWGEFPLYDACRDGNFEAVVYLIEVLDCDILERNQNGVAPFEIASKCKRLYSKSSQKNKWRKKEEKWEIKQRGLIVEYLLQRLPTPLDIACSDKNKSFVELFVKENPYALHDACARDNFATIKYLVEVMGCKVNVLNADDKDSLTKALGKKHKEIIKFLVSKGATSIKLLKENKFHCHKCPICFEAFEDIAEESCKKGALAKGDLLTVVQFDCKHRMCQECFEKLKRTGRTLKCPQCRKVFSDRTISYPLYAPKLPIEEMFERNPDIEDAKLFEKGYEQEEIDIVRNNMQDGLVDDPIDPISVVSAIDTIKEIIKAQEFRTKDEGLVLRGFSQEEIQQARQEIAQTIDHLVSLIKDDVEISNVQLFEQTGQPECIVLEARRLLGGQLRMNENKGLVRELREERNISDEKFIEMGLIVRKMQNRLGARRAKTKPVKRKIGRNKIANYKCKRCSRLFKDKESIAKVPYNGSFHKTCIQIPQGISCVQEAFKRLPIRELIEREGHVDSRRLQEIGYTAKEVNTMHM